MQNSAYEIRREMQLLERTQECEPWVYSSGWSCLFGPIALFFCSFTSLLSFVVIVALISLVDFPNFVWT